MSANGMRALWIVVWMCTVSGTMWGQGKDPGPMTERLKGILEVDPNKKFDLSKARIAGNGLGIKEQKVFEARE